MLRGLGRTLEELIAIILRLPGSGSSLDTRRALVEHIVMRVKGSMPHMRHPASYTKDSFRRSHVYLDGSLQVVCQDCRHMRPADYGESCDNYGAGDGVTIRVPRA